MSHMLVYGADKLHFLKALAWLYGSQKGAFPLAKSGRMVLNSPSQTGKANRFAVDRVDSHAAKLRL